MIHFIYIPVSTSCEILIIHVPTGIPIDFSKFRLEFGLIIRTPIRIPIDNQENITFFFEKYQENITCFRTTLLDHTLHVFPSLIVAINHA